MPIILTESIERPLTMPSQNLNKKINKSFLQTENKDLRDNLKEKMRRYSQELRKKSKVNNSYKPPLKINNFFTDINEEDSKYYNPTQPNLKTSKSNYKESKSIYERRKKYKVPPIKTNNESIENSKENEEGKRDQLISELIYNSEVGFIQDFQKKIQEETKGKDYKDIEQKIHILKDNNIDV